MELKKIKNLADCIKEEAKDKFDGEKDVYTIEVENGNHFIEAEIHVSIGFKKGMESNDRDVPNDPDLIEIKHFNAVLVKEVWEDVDGDSIDVPEITKDLNDHFIKTL
jgi:hypothetical protein